MANNLNVIPNNFILSSAESVRKKILDRLVEYEELKNVDLSKSTFLSYMVDVLSMLSSDNANAISLSKRESYLVTATLPSSIYNWASYLSYTKGFATPSAVNVLITIPLSFTSNATFTIPYDTQFKADSIIYTNPNEYFNLSYNELNNTLTCKGISENTVRNVNTVVRDNNAYLSIPLTQLVKESVERYIPYDLKMYQPYSFTVQYNDKLSNIKVFVKTDEDTQEEEWQRADSYFNMGIGEKKYYFNYDNNNTVKIMFGNDIFGRQPDPGSIVRIEFYETKADMGAIIPGSLTKMDKIYFTDNNGKIKPISMSVVNVNASSTGVSDDTLDDTRRKAIARFRSRQRIVTSSDHDQIKDIISTSLPYDFSKSILKRSDIKTNEVILYVVMPRERKVREPESVISTQSENQTINQTIPIPATSLTAVIDSDTTHVVPYSQYTEGGETYLCPFGFIKETDTFGYYYYLVKSVELTPLATITDQVTYPLSFTKLALASLSDYSAVDFTLSYFNLNDIVDMDNMTISMFLSYPSEAYGPFECTVDQQTKTITYSVDKDYIKNGDCKIEFQIKDDTVNKVIAKVDAEYNLKKELKSYLYSNISTDSEEGLSTVYDVPCIQKSYIDSLTDDQKIDFETTILQELIANNSLDNYRMMNVSINIKFARTCGASQNYFLNKTTKADVLDIINTVPVNPTEGSRYIVGENPTGALAGQNGKIAVYSSSQWYFLDAAPGDIVKVASDSYNKYTYSGNANKWFIPSFRIPYDVLAYVYVNNSADNESVIVNAVKNQILYVLAQHSNIQADQHRSLMYHAIQELGSYIDHCEIKIPEVDITYNYDIDDFTKSQLRSYVPEYIYTDEDHIEVKVLRV